MPKSTLTFVIATERGSPAPLTLHRTEAAVPFGGKYRVIDFTLTNCLHSGLRQALVLTQYKSHSLHKHLRDAWSVFNAELGEFITPLPPQMRTDSLWYQGVIDALRQNRYLIERNPARDLLLLDGALVYRMDYAALLRWHREQGAAASVALRPPSAPETPLARFVCDAADGVTAIVDPPATADTEALVSMGVLLIDKSILLAELDRQDGTGGDAASFIATLLRPLLAARLPVRGYRFGGERGRVTQDRYWSDLASIDAYYQANMALLEAEPPLDLYQPDWNILTYQGQYPPARTVPGPVSGNEGIFVNSMLAAGTLVRGGGVSHSVLFPRVQVDDGAIVDGAILFDGVRVGAGAELRRCILDKDVIVAPGARIGVDAREDRARFDVSPAGIVVVSKGQRV